ncbi:hypothetical protein RN001_008554 [Aquatica leii]|uniref:YqaJ viral recombinase domain-containing protein n=1 Tax=Aquatica leii TaxID=1421715 RepID=A0AAN7SPA2_9COLE|nr:hypothetical protein RN001_008554 [Aquatica leii]
MRYNKSFNWHTSPWKRAHKCSPGKYLKKFIDSQTKYKTNLSFERNFPFLGASPDGLIGDNELIEVKCLFKVAKLGIGLEEAAKTIPTLCLEHINNKVSLKRTHNYYYQVQGQLHITQRQINSVISAGPYI